MGSVSVAFSAEQPFSFHLPLKNSINILNKRAIRRDEMAANHSQGLVSLPVVSADDRLTFDQRPLASREPSPPLLVLGTSIAHRTSWKEIVASGFENNFVGIRPLHPAQQFWGQRCQASFVRNNNKNAQ
jgi:hypothetical protein